MSRRNNNARDSRHQKSHNSSRPSVRQSGPSATTASPKAINLADQVAAAIAMRSESDVEVQIEAIEAAVEILASNHSEMATGATPSAKTATPSAQTSAGASIQQATTQHADAQQTPAARSLQNRAENIKPDIAKTENTKPGEGSGKSDPLHVILQAFREGLTDLKTTLRDEFRTSLSELQASQAAAAASQSEVLRTLTEVMFQSAAVRGDSSGPALEEAIAGLEDRLLHRLSELKTSGPNGTSSVGKDAATSTAPAKSGLSVTTVKLKEASSVVSRSWLQIRNEMMTRSDFGDASEAADRKVEQLPEVAPLTSDRHFRLPEQDPTLEVPKALDPDVLSYEELRDAFREREAFVTTLIARIRRQQESTQAMLSKEQLRELVTELPEELAIQVRQTLKQMEDLARMGELELSLERARVARQVNQLEHTRQILEHNAKQLDMTLNPDGSIALNKNPVNRNSSSRRWLGKLGFGQ
jgi:hypothetical protein